MLPTGHTASSSRFPRNQMSQSGANSTAFWCSAYLPTPTAVPPWARCTATAAVGMAYSTVRTEPSASTADSSSS